MNIFANVFSMIFNSKSLPLVDKKSVTPNQTVYERLSSMDQVFYAYNDDLDQLPFELGEDGNVGQNSVFDDDDNCYLTADNCPGVNVDGTPMVDCNIDINGNPYGITDDLTFDTSDDSMIFDEHSAMFEDSTTDMFEDPLTDMFSDDSSDMFEDSFSSFDDDNY